MPFTDSIKMIEVAIIDQDLISAKPKDVVNGKVFVGTTKHLETGTLPELPEREDITLLAGTSIEIPYGVNKSNYVVTAEDIGVQTHGTATEEDILYPKTAWVDGVKLTGQMVDNGQENDEIGAGESHVISQGYHNGSGVITAKPLSEETQADANSLDILDGKTAWVDGVMVTGSMVNHGTVIETLDAGEVFTFEDGFYNGTGSITANSLESQTQATASSYEILSGYNAWVNGERINGAVPINDSEVIILPVNGTYNIPQGYHNGMGIVTQNADVHDPIIVAPMRNEQVFETAGYYMTGDVTVTGVDALSYQRTASIVKDSTGQDISNYTLPVVDGVASIATYVDNWHDNATFNLYLLTFSDLIDAQGNSVDLNCAIPIDWINRTREDYIFNRITISIELESGTNAHLFTISGITSGKITIVDQLDCRLFGIDHSQIEPSDQNEEPENPDDNLNNDDNNQEP